MTSFRRDRTRATAGRLARRVCARAVRVQPPVAPRKRVGATLAVVEGANMVDGKGDTLKARRGGLKWGL